MRINAQDSTAREIVRCDPHGAKADGNARGVWVAELVDAANAAGRRIDLSELAGCIVSA